MFKTIVVGTDGSKDAGNALRTATWLAQLIDGAEVHVVNAFRPMTPRELDELASTLPEEMHPILHANMGGESILTEAKSIVDGSETPAHYHQLNGDPTDAILGIVDEVGADLVVVGSRGEGLAKRALHGSVSTKLLHHAPCAVLVVNHDR